MIQIPYSQINEKILYQFLNKFHQFSKDKYILPVIWKTRKIRSLFTLKDKNIYQASVIYCGKCSCGADYNGETVRNTVIRWNEHENLSKESEPSKHLRNNDNHTFDWSILRGAPTNKVKREILESFFIAKNKPMLNNQTKHRNLILFKNGIT